MNILETLKVLYVEDEAITREYVLKYLKKNVGKVFTAIDGKDGIEKFMEYRPDIIITDLVMPDMSGIEMIDKLRKNNYKCPVIITSALSDSKTILESIDLKIDKYILKPIDLEQLLEALNISAIQLLEQNDDNFIINRESILSKEERDKLEIEIRNAYTKYLKHITGKGAKSVQVFLQGKVLEIISKGSLTLLEENLLATGKYIKGIEVIRKILYEDTKEYIEKELEKVITRKVILDKVEVYPEYKYELFIFKII